nr:hypothetical protein [Palleronia rufa]
MQLVDEQQADLAGAHQVERDRAAPVRRVHLSDRRTQTVQKEGVETVRGCVGRHLHRQDRNDLPVPLGRRIAGVLAQEFLGDRGFAVVAGADQQHALGSHAPRLGGEKQIHPIEGAHRTGVTDPAIGPQTCQPVFRWQLRNAACVEAKVIHANYHSSMSVNGRGGAVSASDGGPFPSGTVHCAGASAGRSTSGRDLRRWALLESRTALRSISCISSNAAKIMSSSTWAA